MANPRTSCRQYQPLRHDRPRNNQRPGWILLFTLMSAIAVGPYANAQPIPITNAGFEDITGQTVYNEFTFGVPAGWYVHDPNGIVPSPGFYLGTLMPNGVEFFNGPAPEGERVAILFNSTREGEGEYGLEQLLDATLQPRTSYVLSVEVGNIASGTAQNGTFYNLDEFPGYRVDLLAGDTVIASDDNTLIIPEAEFATSTVRFATGPTHPLIGLPLGIRLVNLNIIPPGYTQQTSPDLEVDFDDVRLFALPVVSSTAHQVTGGAIEIPR